MFAKVVLLFAIVAAAHATVLLNSGLVTSPGLLNYGIVSPGLLNSGMVAQGWGSPLLLSNGIVGASPLTLRSGIISPIGLRSAGILTSPGLVQTAILK